MAAPATRKPTNKLRIAVIPGEGIGNEVVPEGIKVLEAVGARFGIDYQWDHYDWSCQRFAKTGAMMPADGLAQIAEHDAIYLGAVGWPGVPDHVSLWGLLIPIRRGFHQYVNVRPVRLLKGVRSPLRDRGPADIDMLIVRENNEGEYSEIGGRLYRNTPEELAVQQAVFTRRGCDRIMRYAFERARQRRKHVTSGTKSNGIIHSMPFWDERFAAMARQYPDVKTASVLINPSSKRRIGAAQDVPTASVTVTLARGRELTYDMVEALARLVSGAVAGLQPYNVTIIDGRAKAMCIYVTGAATDGTMFSSSS